MNKKMFLIVVFLLMVSAKTTFAHPGNIIQAGDIHVGPIVSSGDWMVKIYAN
jgi:hypothetical protein